MRAPDFWWRAPDRAGVLPVLLSPAAAVWRRVTARRLARRPERAGVPVICVGNVVAGGAGKTPMAAWLVQRLTEAGHTPHILSRGHGGTIEGPHRVEPGADTHASVGDEPMLLSAFAPVWIAADRVAGARAAAAAGASVVVMDDGFQNPALHKDVSLLMVDAGQGFGNGRVIPAGPLREPMDDGLARADAVVLVGPGAERERTLARWPMLRERPLFEARIAPMRMGLNFAMQRVVAFAGIGRPAKFFATLDEMGAEVVEAVPFADHYAYPESVLRRLRRTADMTGAMLVTTEKDAVRLPPAFRREVMTVSVTLEPEEPEALMALILDRLA